MSTTASMIVSDIRGIGSTPGWSLSWIFRFLSTRAAVFRVADNIPSTAVFIFRPAVEIAVTPFRSYLCQPGQDHSLQYCRPYIILHVSTSSYWHLLDLVATQKESLRITRAARGTPLGDYTDHRRPKLVWFFVCQESSCIKQSYSPLSGGKISTVGCAVSWSWHPETQLLQQCGGVFGTNITSLL